MLFSNDTGKKLVLLLEVQSAQIRGSLVYIANDAAPHIFYSERLNMPYKPTAPSSYYVSVSTKCLKEMVSLMMRRLHTLTNLPENANVPKAIDEVHYILSSPWIVSQARTVSISFHEEMTMSEDKVNRMLADEREKIKLSDSGPIETIEEKIFDVRLNGYQVSDWHGRAAKEIQISYALSVGSRDSVKKLRESANLLVSEKKIYFHSSLLLQYVSLRYDLVPENESYLLIHIHGELTDVVIVKNGLCAFFGSFPTGVNTIVRKIAHLTNTDTKTAESLLSLYLGNKLDESHSKETTLVMNNMSHFWTDELGKILEKADFSSGLPEVTFILGRTHEDFFIKSFKAIAPKSKIENLHVDMVGIYALAIHRSQK